MLADNVPPRRDSLALMCAVVVGSGIAHLGTSTLPFQIGALMDGSHLSASQAGLFGFFEIGALAVSMMLLAPIIHRFRSATVAMAGVGLTIGAHLLIYLLAPRFVPLLAFATIAGIGYGLVFSAAITGASTSRNPDRIYAIGNGGGVLFVVAMMLLIPVGQKVFGTLGPFLMIAIVLLLTTPALLAFRARAVLLEAPPARLARQPAVIALLVMWASYSLGAGALWSFAERIGRTIGLSSETIGFILSVSTAFGVLGTLVVAVFGGRMPRVSAMVAGLAGTGLSCLLLGYATGAAMFAAGVMMYWIFYMFQYSLFLGVAATIDPEGRVGTMGGGCERFAFAVGAPLGGVIADYSSFSAIGLLGFITCVATIPVCMPHVSRRLALRTASSGIPA